MTHTYQHTYKDGTKVTIAASMEDGFLTIVCTPIKVETQHEAEYVQWRDGVVVPDITAKIFESMGMEMPDENL